VARFDTSRTVMFAGDECFGWDESPPLPTAESVLATIVGARLPLHWPDRIFSEDLDSEAIVLEAEADWTVLRDLRTRFESLQEFKDFLYLDQRLPNLQLPWREYYFGRSLPVRNPLLDRDILEFVRRLPDSARYSRQLYRDCLCEMFPDLFSVPMAASSGNPIDHRALVASQATTLEVLLSGQSGLDKIIPVQHIRMLIQSVSTDRAFGASESIAGWRRLKSAIKSLARRTPFAAALRRALSTPSAPTPLRFGARQLERILLMRCVFRNDE